MAGPGPHRADVGRTGSAADTRTAHVGVQDSPVGPASAHAAACAVLVVPSPPPVDPARGRAFARSLEEADPGVLSDCLRRPEASGS
ncbi:hypothetical protein [Streptomyces sp. NPDC006415]|uniref:hypothetical protein n=1 Tax=Streptomyces sp. NPDC006415 TaxID=3155351 RepID=UPI00339E0F37